MLLSHKFVKSPGTQPFGQWLSRMIFKQTALVHHGTSLVINVVYYYITK